MNLRLKSHLKIKSEIVFIKKTRALVMKSIDCNNSTPQISKLFRSVICTGQLHVISTNVETLTFN